VSEVRLSAGFVGAGADRILVVVRTPAGPCDRAVLVVPPFAEEMNKSRRMVTQVSERLARRGIAVVVPDLYGTGDSAGEFEHASWERWLANLSAVQGHCEELGLPITGVIAIRLGSILAAEFLRKADTSLQSAVFWQPVVDGSRMIDQFLRLRTAASMMTDAPKESVRDLRQRLAAGEVLEVAGYALSPALASAIDAARLATTGIRIERLHWMEVVAGQEIPVPAATLSVIDAARSAGNFVEHQRITGEPFWSATEIVSNPELLDLTEQAICGHA
jgi:exosortase A-associated hydrolase 2